MQLAIELTHAHRQHPQVVPGLVLGAAAGFYGGRQAVAAELQPQIIATEARLNQAQAEHSAAQSELAKTRGERDQQTRLRTEVERERDHLRRRAEYTPELIYGFMAGCVNPRGSTPATCGCMMDKIQNRYTLDEFAAWATRYQLTGRLPEELTADAVACALSPTASGSRV